MSTVDEDIEWARNMVGGGYYSLCEHAKIRMNERNISSDIIEDVVKNGRAYTTQKRRLCFEKDEIRVIIRVMKFRVTIITVYKKGEKEKC